MATPMPLPQSKKAVRSVLLMLLPSPVVLSAFLCLGTGPDIWLSESGGHFVSQVSPTQSVLVCILAINFI